MDGGTGHLTIIEGTGDRAFANKKYPQGRAFHHFFQIPGVCPGGMLTAGIDPHISTVNIRSNRFGVHGTMSF